MESFCPLQVYLCARSRASHDLCARTQLKGNIGPNDPQSEKLGLDPRAPQD